VDVQAPFYFRELEPLTRGPWTPLGLRLQTSFYRLGLLSTPHFRAGDAHGERRGVPPQVQFIS